MKICFSRAELTKNKRNTAENEKSVGTIAELADPPNRHDAEKTPPRNTPESIKNHPGNDTINSIEPKKDTASNKRDA